MVGWCDGAGLTSSAGASYNWDTVGQGPAALVVGAGGGCLDIFTLIYTFSPLSPSLWETARYRLKYCLKGPLNPKQPTNPRVKEIAFKAKYSWSFILSFGGHFVYQSRTILIVLIEVHLRNILKIGRLVVLGLTAL